jgi:hypothetical protein
MGIILFYAIIVSNFVGDNYDSKAASMTLSPYMEIYELVVPKDNLLRRINELIDISFVYDELQDKYCTANGRNAINPICMFKYLLLKSIFALSDVDVVERLKYDMSFKLFSRKWHQNVQLLNQVL